MTYYKLPEPILGQEWVLGTQSSDYEWGDHVTMTILRQIKGRSIICCGASVETNETAMKYFY